MLKLHLDKSKIMTEFLNKEITMKTFILWYILYILVCMVIIQYGFILDVPVAVITRGKLISLAD